MTAAPAMVHPTRIPLIDLARQHDPLADELRQAVARCVAGNRFIGGEEVDAFSREFAAWAGGGHVVPCASGTDALLLALYHVLGPGDRRREVLVPALTFAATAEAVVHAGYVPVFVDVDPETCLMDAGTLEAAVSDRTAAILPVHLYGQMCDMTRIAQLARSHRLALVEDAAQAHGAAWNGQGPGTLGRAACYSFFPGKNLGAWGDGGAVYAGSAEDARILRSLADHGRDGKHDHVRIGFNARLDAIQAAVLRVKLRHLDRWNSERRVAAERYAARLGEVDGVVPLVTRPAAHHAHHLYVVRVRDRDRVQHRLWESGIDAGCHYPVPLHRQPAFATHGRCTGPLPNAERACEEILSLPLFPGITDDEIDRVVDALRVAVHA